MDCDFPSQCRWQPRTGKAEQARINALYRATFVGEVTEKHEREMKEHGAPDANSANKRRKDIASFPVLDFGPSPVEFSPSSPDAFSPLTAEKRYSIGSMDRDSNNVLRVSVVEVASDVDGELMDVDLDDSPEEKSEDSSPTSPSLALRRWGWDWGAASPSIAEEPEDEDIEDEA